MKNLISLFKELHHNSQSRHIRRLLLGGFFSVLIIMLASMLITLKYGTDISLLGTDILGSRYPYSIELLKLRQEINESTHMANRYAIEMDEKNRNAYLTKHASIMEKFEQIKNNSLTIFNDKKTITSVDKKLVNITSLNKIFIDSNMTDTERLITFPEINLLYSEVSLDIGLIIDQVVDSAMIDGQLLNKRFNQLIDFNIGIMLVALIIGFFTVIQITKNISRLINEIHFSKKQSESSKLLAEQKANELSRASQVLVKTNKNLSNSLEKLNSTQDQLVQNEKMASLGGLVAGIAHEINTPIGIGVTAASHLQDNIQAFETKFESGNLKKSEMLEFINTSNEAVHILLQNLERAAKLIQSFKQVAVDQSSEAMRQFNLKEYLQETILSLHPEIKKTRIKIHLNCSDSLQLNSYPGAFSQILTNFVINSLVHAYEENQAGNIQIDIVEQDASIQLIYRDDGKGVEADNLTALFEPFFTTRRGQGGSGLGLHLVYNIVTQLLHGDISAHNNSEGGICFEINIPNQKTS